MDGVLVLLETFVYAAYAGLRFTFVGLTTNTPWCIFATAMLWPGVILLALCTVPIFSILSPIVFGITGILAGRVQLPICGRASFLHTVAWILLAMAAYEFFVAHDVFGSVIPIPTELAAAGVGKPIFQDLGMEIDFKGKKWRVERNAYMALTSSVTAFALHFMTTLRGAALDAEKKHK